MTIPTLLSDVANLLDGGAGAAQSFREQLQPASWKGIPFFVLSSRGRFGRRNAVHSYPFREDGVWVEDLGRGQQAIHLVGFLIGDDVIEQSKRMAIACQTKDRSDAGGELVHPIFGRARFALLDSVITHGLAGRYAELEFTFLQSAPRIYPAPVADTSGQVASSALAVDSSAAASYASQIRNALKQGRAAVQGVVSTVQTYGGQVSRLVADATSLVKTVQGLPGTFGRFFLGATARIAAIGGGSLGFSASGGSANRGTTVADLTRSGTAARANVAAAMAAAQTSAGLLSADTTAGFAADSQAVTAALGGAISDPADRVRIFALLAGYEPPAVSTSAAIATMVTATRDLWRRAALTALARASAAYQPSSYDDAATIRTLVTGALDAEVLHAGDQGEDDVYASLRSLRAAVAQDLTARGADLAHIRTVNFNEPLPALALAQRIYQDPGRADEIVAGSSVAHPAFMPTTLRVLST